MKCSARGPNATACACSSSSRARRRRTHIERFNGIYRKEVLDAHIFDSLADVRFETDRWLAILNTRRPDESLGGVPPLTFLPRPSVVA